MLQKELESARDDQQRLADLEQRLDAARREVGAIETELGRARGRGPGARKGLVPAMVGVLVVSVGLGAYVAMAPRARPPTPTAVAVPQVVEPPRPIMPVATPTMGAPVPPVREVERPASRRANVAWTATVTKSNGSPIRVGSTCMIRAGVIPDSTGMHPVEVEVSCGGLTVYDEKGALNGMSMLDSDAKQRAGVKAGTWVYELAYRDRGDRSSTRNQADLDSTAKIGKVWSDNLPEFRIDLAIRPESAPVDVAVLE